ncbi:hypothetical protein [Methanobacterium aggregans]|uniref:hypothetical protein n=1 Tax=Methanobacterium aggregans TaxID=1615586 RepID=UPI001AE5C947|nr:hypothetical protein [Methanobacterium aggregans]MBP2046788.1 hypothetical protein [Methanobacterium aggregans]
MNLKVGRFSGLISGFIIFSILLIGLINSNSSFDDRLIQKVDSGVPAEDLILEIEEERENEDHDAKKRLESNVMDVGMWGHGDLTSEYDFKYYMDIYSGETRIIDDYARVRTEFVKGQISKEEFLDEIEGLDENMGCIKY